MHRLLTLVRDDWPRLVLELIVLVVGISASFALEQWRSDTENRRVERRVWEAVRDNLASDTTYLRGRTERLRGMLRAYDGLLAGPAADSVDAYMDLAISYVTFVPVDAAYQELRQSANGRQIANRRLLNALGDLHGRDYARAQEWDAINRDFVLARMIPYLDTTAPAAFGELRGGETAVGLHGVWRAVGAEPRFRALLTTNRLFKDAQLSVYEAALARARTLLGEVGTELAR